jgi:hypothetical protein
VEAITVEEWRERTEDGEEDEDGAGDETHLV